MKEGGLIARPYNPRQEDALDGGARITRLQELDPSLAGPERNGSQRALLLASAARAAAPGELAIAPGADQPGATPALRRSTAAAWEAARLHAQAPLEELRASPLGGWALALLARQTGEFDGARVILEASEADRALAAPLQLGDTLTQALERAAAKMALELADAVEGPAEVLEALRAAGLVLGSARPDPRWPADRPPAVSAVIAHKDMPGTLPALLHSLRAQTVPVEIVLVDDGSGAEGLAAVGQAQAGDPALRVLRQVNRGPAPARNAGAEAATGEWLLFCDADNTLRPRMVERLLEAARRRAEVEFVASGMLIHRARENAPPLPYCPVGQPTAALFVGNSGGDTCALHRRQTFLGAGGFASELSAPEDWELWLRYAGLGIRGAVHPEALFDYQLRPGSRSDRTRENAAYFWLSFASRHAALLTEHVLEVRVLAAAELARHKREAELAGRLAERARSELEQAGQQRALEEARADLAGAQAALAQGSQDLAEARRELAGAAEELVRLQAAHNRDRAELTALEQALRRARAR